jgi:hypothetical protein
MGDNASRQYDGATLTRHRKRKAMAAFRPGPMPAFLRDRLGGTPREATGRCRACGSTGPNSTQRPAAERAG